MHARADDLTPWVAAHALIGLHRALLDYVRRQALAGRPNPSLARSIRKNASSSRLPPTPDTSCGVGFRAASAHGASPAVC